MSHLHLICRHPATAPDLLSCARMVQPADHVVLLGPAASAAAQLPQWVKPGRAFWHVMGADLAQYGVATASLPPWLEVVDSHALVALTVATRSCVSW